jgi:hypothetical protein
VLNHDPSTIQAQDVVGTYLNVTLSFAPSVDGLGVVISGSFSTLNTFLTLLFNGYTDGTGGGGLLTDKCPGRLYFQGHNPGVAADNIMSFITQPDYGGYTSLFNNILPYAFGPITSVNNYINSLPGVVTMTGANQQTK